MNVQKFLLLNTFLMAFFMPFGQLNAQNSVANNWQSEFNNQPLASIKLDYVDFKIPRNRNVAEWGKDIGRYNFKLFGCRRMEKNIVLDQGRAMRRDMKFHDVFFEQFNEMFPVIVDKDSPYFPYSIGDKIPNYVLTAEIEDLFVNVCDHYDWRTRTYSQLRSGSSEIKIKWRVMTPYNRKIYWEDTTYGYGEIQDPIRNGEVRLVEKAFADALTRVIGMPGFLLAMQRIPNASEQQQAKAEYDAMAYSHIQRRKNLTSSYRRRRMTFYHERERERILSALERIGERNETLVQQILNKDIDISEMTQEELDRLIAQEQLELTQNVEKLEIAETKASDAQMSYEVMKAMLDSNQLGEGILARLLKSNPIEEGFFGRLMSSSKLLRLFDGYTLSTSGLALEGSDFLLNADLEKQGNKYGFTVSKADGTITINNQKPFRYLSALRIYRIRSSVVAVTNDVDVGSGLIIAPSLVLTNYSIAKSSPYTKVEFLDGRILPAFVLRASQARDVALLYIPPSKFDPSTWPIPLRIDLPDVGENFYAIGTPMRGGFEGALEPGKVSGYRYSDTGVDILTNTTVQSVTLGGILVDEHGNATGLARAGESMFEARDGFIPIGDAFDALNIKIQDRDFDETPWQKALRLRRDRHSSIK